MGKRAMRFVIPMALCALTGGFTTISTEIVKGVATQVAPGIIGGLTQFAGAAITPMNLAITGALVGGASLNWEDFMAIATCCLDRK